MTASTASVAIVGGGFTGAAVAFHLARLAPDALHHSFSSLELRWAVASPTMIPIPRIASTSRPPK